MKKSLFIFILIMSTFLIMDKILEKVMTPYFLSSGQVFLNSYEIVRRDNPEKVWDKVFFGNSVTISSFRAEESDSGYINAGINCGLITDLWSMINTKEIQIGSELVIAFNSALSMYDDFAADPTNPWRRKWYEPFSYFQRDRLQLLIRNTIFTYLFNDNKLNRPFKNQRRELYFGSLSQQELEDKLNSERAQFLYKIKFEDLKKNMSALNKITSYCKKNSIRLRFVWIPPNPSVKPLEPTIQTYEYIKDYSAKNGIDFLDLSGKFDKECYNDQGHFNYEYGSHVLTEVIEPWLKN
ncbi:hypothetical protein IJD44_00245 [bacterium]|nr:hypothetical protein [bacterium]